MNETTMGFIRHALTFIGGWLVTKGYGDESTMTALTGAVSTVIGAVWSYFKNSSVR
jgi:hypothetical protein